MYDQSPLTTLCLLLAAPPPLEVEFPLAAAAAAASLSSLRLKLSNPPLASPSPLPNLEIENELPSSPTTHPGTLHPELPLPAARGRISARHATPTIQPRTLDRIMYGNCERAS
jgi:hypothetical protein